MWSLVLVPAASWTALCSQQALLWPPFVSWQWLSYPHSGSGVHSPSVCPFPPLVHIQHWHFLVLCKYWADRLESTSAGVCMSTGCMPLQVQLLHPTQTAIDLTVDGAKIVFWNNLWIKNNLLSKDFACWCFTVFETQRAGNPKIFPSRAVARWI